MMLRAHGWNNHKKKLLKNLSPLPDACSKKIYKERGSNEGTVDAFKLELSQGLVIAPFLE